MRAISFLLLGCCLLALACQPGAGDVVLQPGMRINSNTALRPGIYYLPGNDSLSQPLVTITGENITVDFSGVLLRGDSSGQAPDTYRGLAVKVENGKNITLKNLHIRGYKIAVMAENVDSLQILDGDLSYNYRQHLRSIRERESWSDWLYYHNNENNEWYRYGAALYLKQCNHALVKGLRVTGGQNALLLVGCNDGLFYNNTLQFNSGLGIGMYRSSRNRIQHNKLDWSLRGYSHGIYSRGQDSAGILAYEQCNDNIFAYNSATHSGDGFFLWAGQSTMDTGEGGCNGNLIYGNDFSFAPTNGVEITFSQNDVIQNKLNGCMYGIWGGYSFKSLIAGNEIKDCRFGVAIEHGQDNAIVQNHFSNDTIGIQLWARESQPSDWGYAKARDVSSRDYVIARNRFEKVATPLKIHSSSKVAINDDNFFAGFKQLLVAEKPNRELVMAKNDVRANGGDWAAAGNFKNLNRTLRPDQTAQEWPLSSEISNRAPGRLPDAMPVDLPEVHPQGRSYMLVDEWGPYDFQSPSIWLREIKGDQYIFLLLGPSIGNWRSIGGQGWTATSLKTGTFPATVVLTRESGAQWLDLAFEFIGPEFINPFGDTIRRGEVYPFSYARLEAQQSWQVSWYPYSEAAPLPETLQPVGALAKSVFPEAAFIWWREPAAGVPQDSFLTLAQTELDLPEGKYRLELVSDDGAQLYLDGKLLIDDWAAHEADFRSETLSLSGKHRLAVVHREIGGAAVLDVRIRPVSDLRNCRYY